MIPSENLVMTVLFEHKKEFQMQIDPTQIEENKLPLIPLNVVLFPGGYLPLHIFEQRYRELVKYCIRNETSFGIVMIKEGDEVGDTATPCKVGTAVNLVDVDRFPDGRMNIMTSGHSRFEILEVDEELPYLVARVRMLDTSVDEPDTKVEKLASETRKVYKEYEALSNSLMFTWQLPSEIPQHPEELAFQIGTRLRISLDVKQKLLEMTTFDKLLSREIEILKDLNKQIAFKLAARNN